MRYHEAIVPSAANKILLASAAVAGFLLGVASTRLFFIGWYNLILWGVVGVALGYFAESRREALLAGVAYGLLLTVTFLVSGFQGSYNVLVAFLILTLGLCVPGIAGGMITAWIGQWLRMRFLPRM